MAKTAFLLGGTGQIGRAAAPRFLSAGWDVVLASRGEWPIAEDLQEMRHVQLDRDDDGALRAALGNGVDVLVDIVAFEQEHAKQLLSMGDLVGSQIVISSGSVYVDSQGRSLDAATNADDFPDFQGPIVDTQATVPAAATSYSTKKVAIEQTLLNQDRTPVTIVRPFAIYGPGGALSREWYFVKRALDGRRFVLLGDRGKSRSQTTSTENLAELILLAAERPRTGVFNCGDPDPPCVLEIARVIGDAMDHDWAEILFEWAEPWQLGIERVGDTPWSTPKPRVADMTLTEIEFGYRPVTTYPEAVRATCEWLVSATSGQDWRTILTVSAKVMADAFDYDAEDAFVRGLTAG
jgi:nucleoside-diphosphate-sugar epimerase